MRTLDLSKLKRYSVRNRYSKVAKNAFAKPTPASSSFKTFFKHFPRILAADNLHKLVDAIAKAHRKKKPIVLMMGAHVLKVGLSPLIVDWIEQGIISGVAMPGSGIIHDFELAYQGQTSEEVAEAIEDGSFGMAKETADFLNTAIVSGAAAGMGLGEAIGAAIQKDKLKHKKLSVFAAAYRKGIPATVHVAVGADIIHQHASCDGAALGQTSLEDFRKLTALVSHVGKDAVVINLGSAVVLPEVFLKAVSTARNLGHPVKDFTAANLDMIQHYRPNQNVLSRPTSLGGQALRITGHHEILFPLVYAGVMEALGK